MRMSDAEHKRRDAEWHRRAYRRKKSNALAVAHQRLVLSIARQIHGPDHKPRLPASFCFDDLVGAGNIALLEAAAKYDPNANGGVPFRLFARHRIRGAILDSISDKRYTEATRQSIDEPGEHPEYERRGTEASRALRNAAVGGGFEEAIDRRRMNVRISEAISWLPAAERRVLEIRYHESEPTLIEAAKRLGVSPERARAMHARAIAALRARLKAGSAIPRPSTPEIPESELPKAA
jgi:RNA polymerase sigma factor FliA